MEQPSGVAGKVNRPMTVVTWPSSMTSPMRPCRSEESYRRLINSNAGIMLYWYLKEEYLSW